MADFVLGRLKFTFLGAWVTGTSYIKDDIITYGGIAYACTGNHTASSFFYNDISNWTKIAPGFNWSGVWKPNTQYNLNDIVRYGADAYITVNQHRSGDSNSWVANSGNFQLFAGGLEFLNTYANTINYSIGDVVTFGGYSYIASNNNINLQPNLYTNAWSVLTTGYIAVGTYNPATKYEPGQVVNYGAYTYVNKVESTGILPSNASYWSLVSKGTQYLGTYNSANSYVSGDVVRFGGNTYIALTETTGVSPTLSNSTQWLTYSTGTNFLGIYDPTRQYYSGDLVKFGGNTYVALVTTNGVSPTLANSSQWTTFTTGTNFLGTYDSNRQYYAGDVVRFGGNTYVALVTTNGVSPTPSNTTQWTTFTTGTNFKNYYDQTGSTQYNPGDIVAFGGNTYVALATSVGIAPTPANSSQWLTFTQGIRNQGTWNSSAVYQLGDTVFYANSSYVSISSYNTNIVPASNTAYWQTLAQGSLAAVATTTGDMIYQGASGLVRLPIGANGQVLIVSNTGLPQWENSGATANVYFVAPDIGRDIPEYGNSIGRPWKTIQYATQRLSSANTPGQTAATLMLKGATYSEVLPITVPAGCSIVGDSTRTTIVQPASGLSLDGSTPNANSTMFYLSDSTMVTRLTMSGMTGYVANNAVTANTAYSPGSDISTHTIAGVFLRLNPASPVLLKSPYVNDVSCISKGGIGALVDGSVHASGNKSMLFHAYTCINDDGVGYYVTNGGRAEIVSCFTYFCNFGYVTNNGGVIRALNGNNSYGRFGAVATGFNSAEVPITANIYGSMLQYQANTVSPTGSVMTSNNYLLGATSNARAVILSFQSSTNQIYFKYTGQNSNTFTTSEVVREYSDPIFVAPTGVSANTQTSSPVSGQYGIVFTANNLTGNTLLLPGSSVQFVANTANVGYDPYAYVIASVSNWSSSPNTVILTLTSTKPQSYTTFDGQAIVIRQQYSNIRLTGHDFLGIGTGGIANTNYPNTSVTQYIPSNQVINNYPGRVYYVSTDQSGNFAVGQYFAVNQATGAATLNASSFNLSGLSSLRLGSIGAQLGAQINEFSTDVTMSQNSNQKVPTQAAVVSYVRTQANATELDPVYYSANTIYYTSNGNIQTYTDSKITISNIVYNSNGFPTNFTQSVPSGPTFNYTVTYFANNIVNSITRQ